MENDLDHRLEELEKKTDAIFVSVEKTRRYFFWTMVMTIVVFVVPLIGLIMVIPSFLNMYAGALDASGGLL